MLNTDKLSKSEIIKHAKHFPENSVFLFDKTDSTNSFAKSLSSDLALVVSDSQSCGRGRLGRSFFSPGGTGAYFSLLVKIPSLYANVPFITTTAAVAIHQVLAERGIYTRIKWVNDIFSGTKKLAGILCETVDCEHAVIGIGINFLTNEFPDELKDIPAFLFDKNPTFSRSELIGSVAARLIELLSHLGDKSIMEYYKKHSLILGKRVTCIQGDCTFEGEATDIDSFGALVVKTQSSVITLSSGEVTVRLTD